jgi:hypothetical protein
MAKLEGLTAGKTEKKEPVKALPKDNGIGGIFVAKVSAIWNKIFKK